MPAASARCCDGRADRADRGLVVPAVKVEKKALTSTDSAKVLRASMLDAMMCSRLLTTPSGRSGRRCAGHEASVVAAIVLTTMANMLHNAKR